MSVNQNKIQIPVPFNYEPKRKNRFYLEFPTDLGIEVWQVRDVKRPSMDIASVEIPYMNETNYVSGRYKWNTMDITFIDPIAPSTSTQLMEWIRLHAESLTGRMGYAVGYKKDLLLKAIDPTGVEIEQWLIQQAMITNIDFGENDQSTDELQTVKITIQPYRCILNY
jgi:hypothetical protein